MNKKKKILIISLIIVSVSIDLLITYMTNIKIDESVKQSMPSYVPKCDRSWLGIKAAPLYIGDLKGCNFQNADLKYTNLAGMDLQYVNLKGANLKGANLKGANLQVAYLQGADLAGADLEYAFMYKANLTRANLSGANFYHAHLPGADLTNVITNDTNFTDATFHVKGLEGAIVPECVGSIDPNCKP